MDGLSAGGGGLEDGLGKPRTIRRQPPSFCTTTYREDPTVGYNTFNLLGNMRDVHPMAQCALAAMATWKEKDVSVKAHSGSLKTITVFTPDTAAGNLGRAHPGGDPIVFPPRPR